MAFNESDKSCKDKCKSMCGENANVICDGDLTSEAAITCKCDKETMAFNESDKTCKDKCKSKCGENANVICDGDLKSEADIKCKCDKETMAFFESDKTCKDRCAVKCGSNKHVICTGKKDTDATTICGCDNENMAFDETDKTCKLKCENDAICGEFKKCRDSPSGVKMCSCLPGKSGEKCDVIDDCITGKYKECKGNNGICSYNDAKETAECNCKSLKKWDAIKSLCRATCSNNCTNFGECEGEDGQKFCRCKKGTSGDFCETVDGCKNDFCGTNKEVVDCEYDKGTEGPLCKCKDDSKKFIKSKMKCQKTCSETSKCENGGTCKGQDPNKICECKAGTLGDMCEIIKECREGKYKNCKGENAECTFEDGKAVCKCDGDKKLDESKGQCRKPCDGDDCKNGGQCKARKDNLKFCDCKSVYSGDTCDKIKDCEEGGKYASCKGENGTCQLENGVAVCKCSEEKTLDINEGKCKYKWCYPNNPCKDNADCLYDKENNLGTCSCKDKKKYYDYSTNLCAVPDKCILRKEPCGENRKCVAGSCKCIDKYKEVDGTCTPNLCDPNPCFGGAKCDDADGNLKCTCEKGKYYDGTKCADGACFLGEYKTTCTGSCPENMKKKDKVCEPGKDFSECSENCGYGYCIQKKDENYRCSCIKSIAANHKGEKNGTCILKEKVVCASKKLTKDLDKCNCTGKWKLSEENGITCELKTCADESARNDCKQKGARCETHGKEGYNCICPTGYVLDKEKNMCTDPCSLDKTKRGCLTSDEFCYNSLSSLNDETGDCRCPPPLKMGQTDGITKCVDVDENVYIVKDIPVVKTRYEVENKINKVLLNADLIQSMKSTFNSFDYGYLLDYQRSGDVLNVSVWIQFKSKPESELNRIPLQTKSFECEDCNSDLSLWPPFVLLDKNLLDGVNAEELKFCHEKSKNTLCGKEAVCNEKNNECSCPPGFKTVEYSIRDITAKFRIERCEDIDECLMETHNCSINTTCVNLPGDFYCQCNANFKKENDPVHSRVIKDKSNCYDLCMPNPCNKGTCILKEDKSFDCKCPLGSEGSFCDNPDVSLASAKKSTVVVGAILGTILGVALIALFLLYRRMKKNSYSEDFAPAPRQDREAEMMERRPVRGMINRAYE